MEIYIKGSRLRVQVIVNVKKNIYVIFCIIHTIYMYTLTNSINNHLSWRRRPSSVVRPSSVNSGFSETAAWIQTKFCG